MISGTLEWLDNRTGYRGLLRDVLYERIPGGARWRYVWGSTLAFTFFVQLVTGVVLWMYYSPSTQTAWESVYYIEFQLAGGWLLRGIHHYMAQAMIVLMALHLMQVVIDGAYRAPREVNFWLGLLLMLVVFALGLTGYLLPWDQKGYWATQVATKIMGITPLVGDELKLLVVGGSQYGHQTLTRFFALHAGVLPGLMITLLIMHLALFRKHGVTPKLPHARQECDFWPEQVLKDGVACLAVLVVVCFLSAVFRAELGAPADPAVAYNSARPEWYYLFLFQFLKLFHGETGEVLGAIVFPGLVFTLMALMPFIGRWKLGHRFNIGFLAALMLGAAGLTAAAWYEDFNGWTSKSKNHLAAVGLAHAQGQRAHQLAAKGIGPSGALPLVRNDVGVAGYRLFKRHCATCHSHYDVSGKEENPLQTITVAKPTAANLFGFATRQWVEGILTPDQIKSAHYFGNTVLAEGDMVEWVVDNLTDAPRTQIENVATALSAEAKLPGQRALDAESTEQIASGRALIIEEFSCIDCHKFGDEGELGMAPDLTGYGSTEWLIEFISNPASERFYAPDNYADADKMMPAFAPHPENSGSNSLTRREIELISGWLRAAWNKPQE
jgi:ubiquinol-cytochrome c reductase cytochrome b subunit